jgi:hypothetical protein
MSAAREPGYTRVVLNRKTQFRLAQLVQEEYTSFGKSDSEFAVYAAEKLEDPQIKASHIWSARSVWEIPSNQARPMAPAAERALIAALEVRLHALEERVNVYLTGCCGDVKKGGVK